jgi:hypothetical protein
MNIDEKIKVVLEKIDGHKSVIGHILIKDDSIGIDYTDTVEMDMVDAFVLNHQIKISLLEEILQDLNNGIDTQYDIIE